MRMFLVSGSGCLVCDSRDLASDSLLLIRGKLLTRSLFFNDRPERVGT